MAPIDFPSCLVADELMRRTDRLLERRRKQAQFRDPQKTLDKFDFNFNKKMNRSLVFDLATAAFIARHEDALFLGPPGTGKSHLAQAIGQAVIGQGYRVIYRETHTLIEEIADASIDGNSAPNELQKCVRLVSPVLQHHNWTIRGDRFHWDQVLAGVNQQLRSSPLSPPQLFERH